MWKMATSAYFALSPVAAFDFQKLFILVHFIYLF
jgi:hypothetical protein